MRNLVTFSFVPSLFSPPISPFVGGATGIFLAEELCPTRMARQQVTHSLSLRLICGGIVVFIFPLLPRLLWEDVSPIGLRRLFPMRSQFDPLYFFPLLLTPGVFSFFLSRLGLVIFLHELYPSGTEISLLATTLLVLWEPSLFSLPSFLSLSDRSLGCATSSHSFLLLIYRLYNSRRRPFALNERRFSGKDELVWYLNQSPSWSVSSIWPSAFCPPVPDSFVTVTISPS